MSSEEQRGRVLAMATILLLAAFVPAASADPPRLVRPGGYAGPAPMGGGAIRDPARGSFSFGDLQLCLDRPGRVRVDAVEPIDGDGIVVEDFAVATPSFALPAGFTTLAAAGLGHRPAFVEQPCDRGQTLLLQIARRDERTGIDNGFRVHYTSAGYAYTVDLPFVMILCAPADTTTDHCA